MGPQHPASEREDCNDADCHNSIVQGLASNGVCGWEAENDRDESDPAHGNESYRTGEQSEVKGPFSSAEVPGVDKANQNWDSVGDVETDCCNGGGGCEGNGASEGGEGEAEGEKGSEPYGADGRLELVVDFVEEMGLL